MTVFNLVSQYIEETVLQSYVWDNADIKLRKKAVKRAETILNSLLGDVFINGEIPIEVLAEESIWVLKIDDTIERADFGMKNVWVDGTMITVADKDNSISPLVYRMLGIPMTAKGSRRKVGGYQQYAGYTDRWNNTLLRNRKWLK